MSHLPQDPWNEAEFVPVTGADSMYFTLEEDHLQQGMLGVALLDKRTMPLPFSADLFRAHVGRQLAVLPSLFRVHHRRFGTRGVWGHTPSVDLDYHVQVNSVAGPLTAERIGQFLTEHSTAPFDRRRPLWDIRLWDTDGHELLWAMRLHHSLNDGIGFTSIITLLSSGTPDVDHLTDFAAPGERVVPAMVRPGTAPTQRAIRQAIRQEARAARRNAVADLVPLTRDLIRTGRAKRQLRTGTRPDAHVPEIGRPTSWTGAGGLDTTEVHVRPIDHHKVLAIKQTLGVRFTPLLYGIAAGALRRHMISQGEPPTAPLIFGCPASTRAPGDFFSPGNQLGEYHVVLPVHIDDLKERLAITAASQDLGLSGFKAGDPDIQHRLLEFLPVNLGGALVRRYSAMRLGRLHPPVFHGFMTTVPYPPDTTYMCGARVLHRWGVSNRNQMCHLDVTILSHPDGIDVALIADGSRLARPGELLDQFNAEIDAMAELFLPDSPAESPADSTGEAR